MCKIYEDENTLTVIAGNGELFEELNQLKRDLELKNVVFVGNKPHEILREIYNIANVRRKKQIFRLFFLFL